MNVTIRKHLINAGVRNLKEYGYPDVNPSNILTDIVYVTFFRSMLRDNIGNGVDKEINALLEETEGREP